MSNLNRHIRLGGSVMLIIGSCINNIPLIMVGFAFVGVGTVNGLLNVENRLAELEKNNAKDEA